MGLYVEPVCLSAQEECEVVVFSITAAQRHAKERSPDSETSLSSAPVSILLAKNDTIVLHAVCTAVGEHALFRFTVPADLLEPSVITVYLAVCNEHGSVVRVVDSGKLLILPAAEAAEVQSLFQQTTKQVQQLVCSSAAAPQHPSTNNTTEAKSNAGLQEAFSGLLARLGSRKHNPEHGSGSSSSSDNTSQPGASTARRVQLPDAATLYSYEHFFVPMLRQWSVVFAHSDGEMLSHSSAIVPEVLASGAAAQGLIMQLLNVLLEHELWACALLLLGKYPALADQVQRAGLRQDDDDGASPMLLDQMRRGVQQAVPALHHQQLQQQPMAFCQHQMLLQQHQRQSLVGYQQQQQTGQTMQQQQQLMLQMQRDPILLHQQQMALLQQHMLLLQQMQQQQQQLGLVPPNMLGTMPAMANAPQAIPGNRRGVSPSGSDETVESASEILMRLGLLQQARGEQEQLEQEAMQQEALADYVQECESGGEGYEQQQRPADFLWASSAWSVPLPYAPPGLQRAPAAKTAPMNLVPVVSGTAVGAPACNAPTPSAAALAATVAAAEWGPGVEGFTTLNAMYSLPEHNCRMSLDCSTHTRVTEQMVVPAAPPAAAAAAATPPAACGGAAAAAYSGVQAEAVGLRQRCGPTGSLFGRQRKLSWEEEQPEPIPKAPFLPAAHRQPGLPAAAAAGWYPGAWQLPEPSTGLLYGAGGGFVGPRYAQPPQPEAAADVCADRRMCPFEDYAEYMVTDPYTVPVFDSEVNGCGGEQQEELGAGEGQQQPQQQQVEEQPAQPGQGTSQQQQQSKQEETSCTGTASSAEAKLQTTAAHAKDAGAEQACCSSTSSSTAGGFDMDACCKGSSCKPGIVNDTCSGSSCSPGNALLQPPIAGLSWQQPWELLRQCAWGFQDPCLESSYLVFKNHDCSLLDATAGLICTSMLLTSTLRSLNSGPGCSVWLQLLTILVYSAFFFLPYIVMKLRLQVFLRLREHLLVFGRNTGAVILAVMALGYLPMVEVWKKVIVHSLSLQIQNGFILPACQQVRLPAALMIAAVHIPADAIWIAAGRPFPAALLHSVLMQVSSVCVALLFDAWCRMRFVQRYSGMTAGRQRLAAPHQQS